MKYTLEINVDNAAFDSPNCGLEIARILRLASGQMEDVGGARVMKLNGLCDGNGNRVGWHAIEEGHTTVI